MPELAKRCLANLRDSARIWHIELAHALESACREPATELGGQARDSFPDDLSAILSAVFALLRAKRGSVPLPRLWVVERSFAWVACFRCLARNYEQIAPALATLHYLAFARLMLASLARTLSQR